MRLSEAIRLGAMIRPQARGWYYVVLRDGGIGSCAMGAAFEAMGAIAHPDLACFEDDHVKAAILCEVGLQWRGVTELAVRHPMAAIIGGDIDDLPPERLGGIIVSLNDSCGWSRERIADWVETIERQHFPEPVTEEAPNVPIVPVVA